MDFNVNKPEPVDSDSKGQTHKTQEPQIYV